MKEVEALHKLFRLVDANINRAAEGMRVLEDIARLCFDNREVSERLKRLRHDTRKNIMAYLPECLSERDSLNDVGLDISRELKLDGKGSMQELVTANFKRVQEALRVVEENLKLLGRYELSKLYEGFRFASYSLEKDYIKVEYSHEKRRKLNTDLYCVTAGEYSCGRDNLQVVRSMINSGVKIIQYREKDKKLIQKYDECLKIREMTLEAGVTFIVNDNIDIAMLVRADGVHIGQDDLPVEKVRELVGDEMIIGLSTHSPGQAQDAVKRGADYIGVGPIFRTFTKKDVCEPVGLEYLDYVVENINIPYVAIGGIKENNMHQVLARGAGCIAMVTEIVGADSIEHKIANIRKKMSGRESI